MMRRLHQQRDAEQMSLRVRLVLLLAVAALGYPLFREVWFTSGFALLAVANVVGFRLCGSASAYEHGGRWLLSGLRVLDVLIITVASFDGPFKGDNLWLLATPSILFEGVIGRNWRGILLVSGAATAIPLMHAIQERAGSSVSAVAAMAMAALASGVLSLYRERERTLQARDERLDAVLGCASALAASADLRALVTHTLRTAVEELDASGGYVMLASEESKGVLTTEAAFSPEGEFRFPDQLTVGVGVTGYAVKMGQPIAIHEDDEQLDVEGVATDARSIVSIPLVARSYVGSARSASEHVLGAITLLGRSEKSFTSNEDMQLLRSLAALVAEAVSNARMEERQRTTFLKTLETLAKSLEARDVYTRGHSQRVCEVSMMIGERLGLSPEALEELRVGTILHDIGKIGVPDSILNKPGRLSDDEFVIMKSHPVIGYEICKPLGLSEGVLMIIRNHHEKLDGSGYPDGLKGGELPLSLRIVCVADAFDAMSSRRPYRDVMAMSRVLAELSTHAGVQFDPVVVEVLKDLLPSERMKTCYAGQWLTGEERAA